MRATLRIGCCLVLAVAVFSAPFSGAVGADERWTPDPDHPHVDDASFTISFVHQSDHYPGNVNEANASLQIISDTGPEVAEEMGAPHGMWLHGVRVWTPFADWSECETDNTAVYGIDRGSNNSGTEYDEGLLQHRKTSWFLDDGVASITYDWDDFAGDPPYMAPEDSTVFEIGARSSGGGCLTMTDEPGWYRAQGYQSGIVHDPEMEGSENADNPMVGGYTHSNYVYICECDSEAEAREQLGPPPNERDEPTPTPDVGASTPTPEPADASATATPDVEPVAETPAPDDGTADETQPAPAASEPEVDDGGLTPTPGDGPGLGALAAILALFAGGIAASRRR